MDGIEKRAEERTKVLIRAALRAGRGQADVCILDLSSRGMLLTMAAPPRRGAFVEVRVHGHALAGQVEWSAHRRFGIRLQERINHAALIAGYDGPIVIRDKVVHLARRTAAVELDDAAERTAALVRFAVGAVAVIAVALLAAQFVGAALHGVTEPVAGTLAAVIGGGSGDQDN